jgi:hypothetical protein
LLLLPVAVNFLLQPASPGTAAVSEVSAAADAVSAVSAVTAAAAAAAAGDGDVQVQLIGADGITQV